MGTKKRGRERLTICDSCGRRVSRDKVVSYERTMVYSTDLKTADDVRMMTRRKNNYCPSCAKSRKIYDKIKAQNERERQRQNSFGGNQQQERY